MDLVEAFFEEDGPRRALSEKAKSGRIKEVKVTSELIEHRMFAVTSLIQCSLFERTLYLSLREHCIKGPRCGRHDAQGA